MISRLQGELNSDDQTEETSCSVPMTLSAPDIERISSKGVKEGIAEGTWARARFKELFNDSHLYARANAATGSEGTGR